MFYQVKNGLNGKFLGQDSTRSWVWMQRGRGKIYSQEPSVKTLVLSLLKNQTYIAGWDIKKYWEHPDVRKVIVVITGPEGVREVDGEDFLKDSA